MLSKASPLLFLAFENLSGLTGVPWVQSSKEGKRSTSRAVGGFRSISVIPSNTSTGVADRNFTIVVFKSNAPSGYQEIILQRSEVRETV